MKPMRPWICAPLVLTLLAGCLVDIQAPSRTPRPTSSPSHSPSATVVPTNIPSPTPGLTAVPHFVAGDGATVSAPGLRVRARPGVDQRVLTSLGIGTELLIALGPVWVDDTGWYLVRDANQPDLGFTTGWVSPGTSDDPFLQSSTFDVHRNPYLAGFAGEADGDVRPVTLPDLNVSVAWLAAPLTADGCAFFVDLAAGGGEPVKAIRATIGGVPAPGELFPSFFAAHDALIGRPLTVMVRSDCSWALTFVQERPKSSPSR
jgi:hypothetical protein